jgi:hypothetical protein
MHLLLTDETNLQAGENIEFFSYGGLIVPLEKVASLNAAIGIIRATYGYQPADRLKFDTNARPPHVPMHAATSAKKEVIAACIEHQCKFLAYVVLHAIAQNTPLNTTIQWGADHIIGKFNFFLQCLDSHGMVAMDRLPDGVEFDYLASKFVNGLVLSDGDAVQLDRIALFSSTCINASHLTSAMDIVLGSWRYCINKPFNEVAAKSMMADLVKLVWCDKSGENIYAFEKGLVFRPKEVKSAAYKAKYEALLAHMNSLTP